MRRHLASAILAAALALPAAAARPEPVTLSGITFSDELGGVVLHRGWGSGSTADPFVLVEDITDEGPAVLVVRGLDERPDGLGRRGAGRNGFALRKIVTNRTDRTWAAFELELRERLEAPSTYEDGLSFGQAIWNERAFAADRYRRVSMTDEPLDAVVFSDGIVLPGETVTVTMAVTDYTPLKEFYLLQRRDGPVAALPARGLAAKGTSR